MKTAQEMHDYCEKNRLGLGLREGQSLKNFSVIVKSLAADEDVAASFDAIHNYASIIKHDGNYSYAITNKRIIWSQKRLVGETVKSCSLDKITDITVAQSKPLDVITINAAEGKLKIAASKETVDGIYAELQKAFSNIE